MKRKLLINLLGFFAAVFIVVPFCGIGVFAEDYPVNVAEAPDDIMLMDLINTELAKCNTAGGDRVIVTGTNNGIPGTVSVSLPYYATLIWQAETEQTDLSVSHSGNGSYFTDISGKLRSLSIGAQAYVDASDLTVAPISGPAITLSGTAACNITFTGTIVITSPDDDIISDSMAGSTVRITFNTVPQYGTIADGKFLVNSASNVQIASGTIIDHALINCAEINDLNPDPDPGTGMGGDTTTTPPADPDNSTPDRESSSSSSSDPEPVKPSVGDVVEAEAVVIVIPETATAPVSEGDTAPTPVYVPPKVVIADDTPIVVDDKEYAGTVKVDSVNSNRPQEIPKEVIIGGESYLVGDTVYIVGTEEKKVEATAETGFSYVFTAVENSDKPVKFKAEGLPDALEMTEDGVIITKTLPIPAGEYTIEVTADNGADTSTYTMTIEIKEGGLSDEELIAALTANDNPALAPEILSLPGEEPTEGEEAAEGEGEASAEEESKSSIPTLWVNGDVSLHYAPETEDFFALFLDGKLLTSEEDYRIEEGSTVIILTEQTMSPLPSGDHVVTTMFHQNTEVGLDTVINDVGSSSFVFRFGDDKTSGKRVNIGGDGVTGSVTFDDTKSKEEPITTISANSEEIEIRSQNLSNATGREIIAAFETKQHGGFSSESAPAGRVVTFAVSVKSLNLTLKNGTSVYVAVYDSTTDKTYQNKGEIKDGMIVFRTKHSGVFMVAKEKF
jgi:hypothetical protein